VSATIPFSKRYIKYLTKRYLKKEDVKNYLRIISTSKSGYELRFHKVADEAAAE